MRMSVRLNLYWIEGERNSMLHREYNYLLDTVNFDQLDVEQLSLR